MKNATTINIKKDGKSVFSIHPDRKDARGNISYEVRFHDTKTTQHISPAQLEAVMKNAKAQGLEVEIFPKNASTRTKMTASSAMKRAWAIRKEAAKKYGCKSSEISMSACLKMAWAGK